MELLVQLVLRLLQLLLLLHLPKKRPADTASEIARHSRFGALKNTTNLELIAE